MRLGLSGTLSHKTPQEWAKRLRSIGCGSVNFPVDYTWKEEQIEAYAQSAKAEGLVIGEVGAWCNPISPDEKEREAALLRCKEQLRLADRIGARCCVNVSGSRGKRWDGAYRENFTEAAWEMVVKSIQEILDEVQPTNTYYTIEPMPWMYPTSPEEYQRLLEDVDRERFAVHLDLFNWVMNTERYFAQESFMEKCFGLFGNRIKSCHLKDVHLRQEFTLQFQEVPCGQGEISLEKYAALIERIDGDMPVIIEHLDREEDYLESLEYVKKRFKAAGIMLK